MNSSETMIFAVMNAILAGDRYPEHPSSILTLWVNPFPFPRISFLEAPPRKGGGGGGGLNGSFHSSQLFIRDLWSAIYYVTYVKI